MHINLENLYVDIVALFMGLCHTAAILSRETEIALFYLPSLAPTFFTSRVVHVKQSFFSLLGQHGCRVNKAHSKNIPSWSLETPAYGNSFCPLNSANQRTVDLQRPTISTALPSLKQATFHRMLSLNTIALHSAQLFEGRLALTGG